jgi:2-polyprenyl-3-methyl-5-hydroxy-6-metoxy-1,4-benzoquinol methylase
MGFRQLYNKSGVDEFYKTIGHDYSNPHLDDITTIIKSFNLQGARILDLACGGGEVTRVCQSIGCVDITGMDPYTGDLYYKNTGIKALPYSFQDVAYNNVLQDKQFDIVICSFALHLCPQHVLKLTCLSLAQHCKVLVVISPHKKPYIGHDYGWTLVKQYKHNRIHVRGLTAPLTPH